MRTGGCTVQQALTAEAAAVVKQAVTLARRRGHAQVTPLHVANTMLASASGLLRTACLQSHSHPLQCKALELCFNVALNRLPASTSSPMLGSHSQQFPSISNALVAAFKRAQAHQRRGSIESQQQPLLAVKIELEQLIVSILDDPSVSRVMREAGFSSTQVKSNIEQVVSLEMCSKNAPSTTSKSKESNALALPQSHPSSPVGKRISKSALLLDPIRNEDVMTVIDFLVSSQRRSFVIVGECLGSIESVVKGVMDKVHNGDVPEVLRELKFITLAASSFRHLSVMEVEQKFEELRCLVGSYMRAGVVLNLGDLKCAIENSATSSAMQPRGYFCPMERMIMKLGELASGIGEKNNGRFWLTGLATFQTYMKFKSCHPSQNTVWGLHPLTIPAGCLRLSLIIDSDQQSESQSNRPEKWSTWIALEGGEEKNLKCCADCSAQFEIEARSLQSRRCNSDNTTSSLPAWLKECKNEKNTDNSNDKDCILITDLCRKWNSICSSNHQHLYSSDKTHSFASVSPAPSTSGLSYDFKYPNWQQIHHDWPIVEPKQSWREHHIWIGSEAPQKGNVEPGLRLYVPEHRDHPEHPFSSDPNSTPNSTSSSDVMDMEYVHRFKELNAENLKTLCNALERKVPWQKDIIPDIASTILQCRSGMVRRKGNGRGIEPKEETWMLFQGLDTEAKEKIAKELASLVFGSQTNHVSIALSSFSSTRADSTEDFRNKRTRDEQACSYIERFAEAVSSNPHRVFLVEDVDQADYCSQMGFKRAIEGGKITNSKGEDVGLSDSIIILSCESFSSRSRACTPPTKQKTDGPDEVKSDTRAAMEDSSSPCPHLDLNISMDDDKEEDQSVDDIGLLDSVDRRIVFSIQEL